MARIQTETQQDLQAPGVSIAPVSVQPSPLAEFTEKIKPIITKGGAERTGSDITLAAIEGFEKEVEMLNEQGELNEVNLKATTAKFQSALSKGLLNAGVDPEFFSNQRQQFEFAVDSNQFFQVEKDGDIVTTHNTFSGETRTTFNTLPKAQLEVAEQVTALIPPTAIMKSLDLEGREQQEFLAPYERQALQQYQDTVQIQQQLSTITAANDLAAEKEENQQRLTRDVFNQQINNTMSRMNETKDLLVRDLREGRLTPQEAEASMEEWFQSLRENASLNEFVAKTSRDPQEFFKTIEAQKGAVLSIISNYDPQKELSYETLGRELALRNFEAETLINMPERAREQLLISSNMQALVMSHYYMETEFAKTVPAIAYQSLLQNDQQIVRERFAPVWAEASDEDPSADDLPNTNAAVQIVLNSLYHLNKGDLTNPEAATLDNTLVMYEKLKQLDTYNQLDPRIRSALDARVSSLYSVFEGDRERLRLLRQYVDETKDDKGFFGGFFGNNQD